MKFATVATPVIRTIAHPLAILGFPLASVAWLHHTGEPITYLVDISIAAISIGQIILYDSLEKERVAARREQALQDKASEVVRAIPQANNAFIGIEEEHGQEPG